MSTFTDDELGELLRETFHAHERADDADRAQRIASPLAYPVRRHRVPPALIAVAAGIVIIGGLVGLARSLGDPSSMNGSTSAGVGAAPAAMPNTEEGNRDATRAEAQRLVDSLALPHGAVRTDTAQAAPLRSLGGGPIVEHPVTATGFWTVPGTTAAAVQAYLIAHPAPGMTATTGSTFTHTPTSDWTALTVTERAQRGSAAYAPPELAIDVIQNGPDVAVRADAFLNWRSPRPPGSEVTGTVTSVTVAERPSAEQHRPTPKVVRHSITDQRSVSRLVRLVDGLPGPAPWGPHGCFALVSPVGFTTLIVHSDEGTWQFRETLDCAHAVTVARDGRRLGTIDDTGFIDGVAAIVK